MSGVAHPLALGIAAGAVVGGLVALGIAVEGPRGGLVILGILFCAIAFTAFMTWALCGSIFGDC